MLLVESLELRLVVLFCRLHTSLAVDTVFDHSSAWLDFVFSAAPHKASNCQRISRLLSHRPPTPEVSLISVLIVLKLLEVFFFSGFNCVELLSILYPVGVCSAEWGIFEPT